MPEPERTDLPTTAPAASPGPAEAPAEPAEVQERRAFHQAIFLATPRTWFTWIFLIANIGVFLTMAVGGVGLLDPEADKLVVWGADYGPRTLSGQWWRLLTSMFIHIGLIHLALNMWALWNVGHFVERLLGNAGFLALYLLAGLGGGLASLAWNPYIVSAGASGAIFGLFGALAACLIRLRRQIPASALSELWKSTLACVAFNVYFGITTPGIDNAAHLGGLATGLFAGLVLARPLAARSPSSERRRAALVAAAGVALLVAGAAMLPRNVVDYREELAWFGQEETRAVEAHNLIVARAKSGGFQPGELPDALDKDLAPRWREMHRRMSAMKGLPRRTQAVVDRLAEYAGLRLKSVELLAEGLRKDQPEIRDRAREFQKKAEGLLKNPGGG